MNGIMDSLEEATKKLREKRYQSHKFCYDSLKNSVVEYEPDKEVEWQKYSESEHITRPKDLTNKIKFLRDLGQESWFKYFLDGSRHTYKVDDMAFGKNVYPILAGQVGISCCTRVNKRMHPLKNFFNRKLVIVVPTCALPSEYNKEADCAVLLGKINQSKRLIDKKMKIDDVLMYNLDDDEKFDKKGIAKIQDYMIQKEKEAVKELVKKGLMKLVTYHRMIGDEVVFYKGTDKDFAINETLKLLLNVLHNNEPTVSWRRYWEEIAEFITKGGKERLDGLLRLSKSPLVKHNLERYRKYYYRKEYLVNPQWDRVCITTLFTFYWQKTIDAINFYKQFCKDGSQIFVGGIAASVVPNEIEKETGIRPIVGLLDKGGELDDNDIIIENLALDYSILEEIDYTYPEHDGYYGYMTRGCVNHCAFCVVPKLEPVYTPHIPLFDRIRNTRENFGEKRNLLLLDNNVFASEKYDAIIDEIKNVGFVKGSMYVAPNYYEITIKNLEKNFNIPAYCKSMYKQYKLLMGKIKDEEEKKEIAQILVDKELDNIHTITKENILSVKDYFAPKFEKIYKNKPKTRYVDFNQGVDARLINEKKIKKLAEIPINPLRIAFDHWNLRDIYENAVRLAASAGINHLSNYLLYNFKDKPEELYYRMRLNIDLCEELNISIYSFPMKYHPIQDVKYFKDRDFMGEHWNRKFIRAIQAILNSTKGKIGKGKEFFERAFGKNKEEYFKRLYMPETMLIYRNYYEYETGLINEWWDAFNSLTGKERDLMLDIVKTNDFENILSYTSDNNILRVLQYYQIGRNVNEAIEYQKNRKEMKVKPLH